MATWSPQSDFNSIILLPALPSDSKNRLLLSPSFLLFSEWGGSFEQIPVFISWIKNTSHFPSTCFSCAHRSIWFLGATYFALHRQSKRHLGVSEFVAADSLIFALLFSPQHLLEGVVSKMKAPKKIHWIDKANHGMAVKGRTTNDVMEEINAQVFSWLRENVQLQHK